MKPDPVAGDWDRDADLIAATSATGRATSAVYPHADLVAVVGRGGDPWIETYPDQLAADGVPLLRRRGGGCAVVLDPGNLVCSMVLPRPGIGGITSAFGELSRIMVAALAEVGLTGVVQEGTSDLAVADRKLGGSCIWRTRGLVYYSTTLLVVPAWELIDRYLPHPPREPAYRRGRRHREFLTSLSDLGFSSSPFELADRLGPTIAASLREIEKDV